MGKDLNKPAINAKTKNKEKNKAEFQKQNKR